MGTSARIAICTIVARNYISLASSMLASVAEFEPALDRFVFLLDDVTNVETAADGTVIRPADVFDAKAYGRLARDYDVVELATAVKPAVLRYLLDRGYDGALYLDADIQVFAPLDVLVEPLANNDIVLTPHVADATPLDGRLWHELVLLRTGIFNLGFIGVANTPAARAMLDWWEERLAHYSRRDVMSGLFVDQRWLDLVPAMFERTAIVRHRGCNVAYWNLRDRRLAEGDELRLESGERVIFFHFSGFDARRPDRLCNIPTPAPTRVSEYPRLQRMLAGYAQRLIERGHLQQRLVPYAFGRFKLQAAVRALYRKFFLRRAKWLYPAGRR